MKPDQRQPWTEIVGVLENYELGDLIQSERNVRGYLNTSYEIETINGDRQERYFLRRYRAGTQLEEIQFEHAVIEHLLEHDFDLVAKILKTREGKTYVSKPDVQHPGLDTFYTVFEYLPGKDKYSWIGPECTPLEIKNAAATLAAYHGAIAGFIPPGFRAEPGILDLLPVIEENLLESVENSKHTEFDAYLEENLDLLLRTCKDMQQHYAGSRHSEFPRLVIHSDFHPGNLRFDGEQVVAMFDFDWSKIDLRCFDVGLALWYFFTSWKPDSDGMLRTGEAGEFLESYQQVLRLQSRIEPLDTRELENLPLMINLGNLYVLNWTVMDYYAKPVDVNEYLIYLEHHVRFSRWYSQGGQGELSEKLVQGSF